MLTLWEIFNCNDGRTVAIIAGTETGAMQYAAAIGGAYDCSAAHAGWYVERKAGARTDYLLTCYATRLEADRRANMENMGSDSYSFAVVRNG